MRIPWRRRRTATPAVADAPVVPPDDHLTALLRGGSVGGEGAYNGVDSWWATLGAQGSDSPAGRLVTVHEALHASLNDCTAFGVAMAATGVLNRFLGHDDALVRLVGMCRTTHEAYATFGSLWLVSEGDLSLLSGRPDYLAWYRDAAQLVPLPDGARLTQLALDEAARVCMQSGALDDLLAVGLDARRPEVSRADRPDVRFGWLHELADDAFWTRTWRRCTEADLPGWEVLAADDPEARERAWAEELSPTCAAVSELLYVELAALLERRGARTLGYDDHQQRTAEAIAHVERLVPEARGLLRASTNELPVRLESFEVWSRERLIVRDRPRPARLYRIEDRPPVGLLSEHRGRSHVFCIARPAFRLRTQFAFEASDDAVLARLADQPVVAVVSAGEDVVDLVVLSRPQHLEAVLDVRPGALAVLVNVTLSCLGNIEWRDRWARVLGRAAVTGLVDLVPLRQFDTWRDDGSVLRYGLGTVDGGRSGASLFVCELDGGGLRLLLPCTHVTADVMAQYLAGHYPRAERTAAVFDGVQDLVEITTSHLLSIDHAFDVTAYYQPPGGTSRV